jgi:hypothetical protein
MQRKIYNKRGNKNYKEKRLLKELNEHFEANPDQFENVKPADNFKELQEMYDNTVFEEYEDISENKATDEPAPEEKKPVNTNVDPLSRNEPIIRDYVIDNANNKGSAGAKTFSEPVSFDDTFSIPDAELEEESEQPVNSKQTAEKEPPLFNPQPSGTDSKKRRRKTERFAKSIVNLTCDLWERGFVWFVTKDITDDKLMEYETDLGVDLELLLEMGDGQKATVRQFFTSQRLVAEEVSKIDQEDRDDLTDALVEVFLEKGIQPTATQDLVLIGMKVFGGSALKGFSIVQPVKLVLSQIKNEAELTQEYAQQQPPQQPEPQEQTKPAPPMEELSPDENISELAVSEEVVLKEIEAAGE